MSGLPYANGLQSFQIFQIARSPVKRPGTPRTATFLCSVWDTFSGAAIPYSTCSCRSSASPSAPQETPTTSPGLCRIGGKECGVCVSVYCTWSGNPNSHMFLSTGLVSNTSDFLVFCLFSSGPVRLAESARNKVTMLCSHHRPSVDYSLHCWRRPR